jgi:hypothetical protein
VDALGSYSPEGDATVRRGGCAVRGVPTTRARGVVCWTEGGGVMPGSMRDMGGRRGLVRPGGVGRLHSSTGHRSERGQQERGKNRPQHRGSAENREHAKYKTLHGRFRVHRRVRGCLISSAISRFATEGEQKQKGVPAAGRPSIWPQSVECVIATAWVRRPSALPEE